MHSALDSAIGLPSRSSSASWMLALLMPLDVRRNLMLPPGVVAAGENFVGAYEPVHSRDWQTTKTHRIRPIEPAPSGDSRTLAQRGVLMLDEMLELVRTGCVSLVKGMKRPLRGARSDPAIKRLTASRSF